METQRRGADERGLFPAAFKHDQLARVARRKLTLAEAQQRIETWRQEYHTERPHKGLGQRIPAEYAALFTLEDEPFSTPIPLC